MSLFNLIDAKTRIETPFICVTIGDYTFGVYQKTAANKTSDGVYLANKFVYPNYIKSLKIDKINGQVNQYELQLVYTIRPGDDPNFFEKVFSSVNQSRRIKFSYGDMSMPEYIYKNEEAIITDVTSNFELRSAQIGYVVKAVSSATLGYSGNYSFQGGRMKPSDRIKQVLANPKYGLKKLFYGMTNDDKTNSLGLIASNDKIVKVANKTNVSALEYIKYLVSCMIPDSSTNKKQTGYYSLVICDEVVGDDTVNKLTEELGGPYFKVISVDKRNEHSDAYQVDIGYPSSNIITSFRINNNENYSIYYDWQSQLNDNQAVYRIDDEGNKISQFTEVISSKNNTHVTRAADKVWWTKITEYPISAEITLKGLLRPAILMEYAKLNVIFFGIKHISSGLYIITKQTDTIDASGYRTALSLVRVQGESKTDYDY